MNNKQHNYVLLTDSSCDLPEETAISLGLQVLPLVVNLSGREYKKYPFEKEVSIKQFYNALREGQPASTAAANADSFIQVMTPFLEKGKDIIYLGFSSALSATFNNSCIAAEELKEKYPDRKITCIDSRCASLGQGLLVYLTAKEKEKGASYEELCAFIEKNIPHLCHWFTVDDLHFLKRGGRISATTAVVGSILHIKPVLHVDDEGRLINIEKVRGRKAAIKALYEKIAEKATDIKNQIIMISHGDCYEEASSLAEMIKTSLHPKEILINTVGPVIGAHSGPGTIALFFLGGKR